MCSQQLFHKQSEKNNLCALAKAAFDVASPQGTIELLTTQSYTNVRRDKDMRFCSPKLQSTKCCAGLFFCFSAGRATSQTVPSDLRLKLDQLHTSLPFHTVICSLFFTCLIAICLSVCLPPTPCHDTLCHNSAPSLL